MRKSGRQAAKTRRPVAERQRQHELLDAARTYIAQLAPELKSAPITLRPLDGPPEGPRYVVIAEACLARVCPHGTIPPAACHVLDCPLRHSLRLLLDQKGLIIHMTRSGIHWNG